MTSAREDDAAVRSLSRAVVVARPPSLNPPAPRGPGLRGASRTGQGRRPEEEFPPGAAFLLRVLELLGSRGLRTAQMQRGAISSPESKETFAAPSTPQAT
jgi:hypothetical protein